MGFAASSSGVVRNGNIAKLFMEIITGYPIKENWALIDRKMFVDSFLNNLYNTGRYEKT